MTTGGGEVRRRLLLVLAGSSLLGLPGCSFGGGPTDTEDKSTRIAAGSRGAGQLRECLTGRGLDVRRDGRVPGRTRVSRGYFEPESTRYAGSAFWPSGNVVDIYLAMDEEAAAAAESELETVLKKFGRGAVEDLSFHRGPVVYTYDDFDTPTPEEARIFERCLSAG